MRIGKKERERLREEARQKLTELLPIGSTIHCISRRTGYSVYLLKDNKPLYLTGYIARLLGLRLLYRWRDALVVDSPHEVAHALSSALHGRANDPRWVDYFADYIIQHKAVPWHVKPGYTIQWEEL